ncbi:MAG: hypothetical protein R3F43_26540 [bacterium]
MQPTLRAVLLFALGVPAALAPAVIDARLWLGWIVLLGLGLVALVADALLALPWRRLVVTPTAPEVLYIGDPDPLEVLVSAGPRAQRLELQAELGGVLAPADAARAGAVGADAARRGAAGPGRRGLAVIHALWLRWEGPLGLVRRQIRLPLGREIPVVPNLRAVRSPRCGCTARICWWA